LPKSIAVGENKVEPTPSPIMYRPVVRATRAYEALKVLATSLKPAAKMVVMPPPSMQ
jgi:hypothetical protein